MSYQKEVIKVEKKETKIVFEKAPINETKETVKNR